MKIICVFVCINFIVMNFVFPIETVQSHSDHPDDWDLREEVRRLRNEHEETRWRQDEERRKRREDSRDDALKTMLGFLAPPISGSLSMYDSLNTLVFGPTCEECGTYVNDDWDHRATCSRGHYYWRCNGGERSFHKYCTSHPTNCPVCGGAGCPTCYDPSRGLRCLACGVAGSHRCIYDDSD